MRISALIAALIACLAIGSVAVAAKKKGKRVNVQSTISLQIGNTPANGFTPGASTYFGTLTAGGPDACTASREVTVSRNGAPHTQANTSDGGQYGITVAAGAPSGTYTASVPELRIPGKKGKKGKRGKTTVCSAATSSPVAIP
jgi:hypothetical protein